MTLLAFYFCIFRTIQITPLKITKKLINNMKSNPMFRDYKHKNQ